MTIEEPCILVNLDASDDADGGVIYQAQLLAKNLDASIHLFRSNQKPMHEKPINELTERQRKKDAHSVAVANDQLNNCIDKLIENGFEVTSTLNWNKPFSNAIRNAIEEHNAELIVSRQPPFSLLDRLDIPDAAWQLTKLTDAPVVFINPKELSNNSNSVWAAVDPVTQDARRIRLNETIIERAKQLNFKGNDDIHLVHCYESTKKISELAIGLSSSEYLSAEDKDEQYLDHYNRLHELAERHEILSTHVHIVPGLAQVALPLLISKHHPQAVVAGANNKGRLKQFVYGSTTKKLLHRSECSVCVVRLPR